MVGVLVQGLASVTFAVSSRTLAIALSTAPPLPLRPFPLPLPQPPFPPPPGARGSRLSALRREAWARAGRGVSRRGQALRCSSLRDEGGMAEEDAWMRTVLGRA